MGKKLELEDVKDGKFISNRSCTDCLMIIVFALFMCGWAVVAGVGFSKGKPIRIILPSNFRGDLCADGDLTDFPVLFYPKPSRLSYGFCVPTCPSMGEYVCNNDFEAQTGNKTNQVRNSYYAHTQAEYTNGFAAYTECSVLSCTGSKLVAANRFQGLSQRIKEFKCFMSLYDSGATLYRCLPFQPDRQNLTLAEQANETSSSIKGMTAIVTAGQFFDRGFGEIKSAWIVILICCGTAMIISLLWVFLLRFILAPVVYTCLLLVLAVLLGIGFVARKMGQDLDDVALPGDTETSDQRQIWLVIEYAAWVLSAAYFFLVIWLLKRIRIGMELMKEGGKAFLCAPYMVVVPPIVVIGLIGITAYFAALTIYIQTITEVSTGDFTQATDGAFGAGASSAIANAANSSNYTNTWSVNITEYKTNQVIKALHAYNFFGFLWIANYFIMEGFFVCCMVTCVWYFSASQQELQEGKDKHVPLGTVFRAFWVTIRYHPGSIMFGALLIAIVQFIQALVLYFEREVLQKVKDNPAIKFLLCVINCLLWCIEKTIKMINKASFTLICIKNCNFCSGCGQALGILVSNAVRVGTLASMVNVVTFILKLFICASNTLIGFGLLRRPQLIDGTPIQSGLFPLISIFLLSYIIASIFLNVYESCVDTVMMCFFVDETDLTGKYMPEGLARLVGMFTEAEKARQAYEAEMNKCASAASTSTKK
eukprot:PhF_6_TR37141/c1_g1_i1/m.54659/K15377/SLC44A2_4_5; solute carrier family 44 (choline transporter-like protein), member 2/4/5